MRMLDQSSIPFDQRFGLEYPINVMELNAEHVHDVSLPNFLTSSPSTAIYWINKYDTDPTLKRGFVFCQTLLLAVNYHMGHSEGKHKTVVQDVINRIGPWVLFAPPGSDNKTFHLEDVTFPGYAQPRFSDSVANPLKIKKYFVTDEYNATAEFVKAGYSFIDTAMSDKERLELQEHSSR